MIEPADIKIAVLQVALGIKALEDKELFDKLEEFWISAYARGRADELRADYGATRHAAQVLSSPVETNRDKVLRGEVVKVSDKRLLEMQEQTIFYEGVTDNPVYHWHWAAVINELIALRRVVASGGA